MRTTRIRPLAAIACGVCVGSVSAQIEFDPAVEYRVGESPWNVTAADFNQDGWNDLATSNFSTDDVSVLINDRSGGFLDAVSYPNGSTAGSGIVAALLNDDAFPDIATANHDGNDVSVLLNDGSGGFLPAVTYPVGDRTWQVDAGDLDGDGDTDLAAVDILTDTLSVLMNNGDGTFAPVVQYTADISPIGLELADLDDDGDLDAAVANFSFFTISILLNNGDGTFAPRVHYPAGGGSRGIKTADFDCDGAIDLAVANSLENSLSIYRGNGDGTFGPRSVVAVGNSPYEPAVGDFDGDEHPDVAVAMSFEQTVSMLRGKGDGTFQPFVSLPVSTAGPLFVEASDLDNDRKLDLATANSSANTATVLINESLDRPVLDVDPVLSGPTATFKVAGAQPGDVVNFAVSRAGTGAGPCVPAFGGICVKLQPPVIAVGSQVADANGDAAITVNIPAGTPAGPVFVQAVAQRGGGGADSITTRVQTSEIP